MANQKGGVAKTSSTRNLAYSLAEMGQKVLAVDFDPQTNLTISFGIAPTTVKESTASLMMKMLMEETLPDRSSYILHIGNIDLIPSKKALTVAEVNMLIERQDDCLDKLLAPLRQDYDYILVDTGPSLGSLTDVELRKNTDVNTGWLSSEPLTQYEYLTRLDGSKVAISVTIPTFAKGGSGKVESGDIIMLFATDKDTGETTQPPELRYVEVLAATQSSGTDKEYQMPQEDKEKENPEETLPATITLLVNTEQARILANLEESNKLHLAFVYRGTRENAEKFLTSQEKFFTDKGMGTENGVQSAVPDVPEMTESTNGKSVEQESAEKQEVKNADGE